MKISLAIDNCFAKKRWVKPSVWAPLIRELGLRYVEASADNEIDPLYSTPTFLDEWAAEVEDAQRRHDVRVVNLYSGHGTYSTIGLAHFSPSVREHLKNNWMTPMLRMAARLGAGLGFYAHAFTEEVLGDPALYAAATRQLVADLRDLAAEARNLGVPTMSIEQMYSPNQIPWTLEGTGQFLRDINAGAPGSPVCLTLDTGHCCGQDKFLAPTPAVLSAWHRAARLGGEPPLYLGSPEHYRHFLDLARNSADPDPLIAEFERFQASHGHLFSRPGDGDIYRWIERFGASAPILHLQQTDGKSSTHKPFIARHNAAGIIEGARILQTLAAGEAAGPQKGLPRVDHLYLTIEVFLPTACDCRPALQEIKESVQYWRQFVPEDGMEIEAALDRLGALAGQ